MCDGNLAMANSLEIDEPALSSCPFCGGEGFLVKRLALKYPLYDIGCRTEDCYGWSCLDEYCEQCSNGYAEKCEAIQAWNTRVSKELSVEEKDIFLTLFRRGDHEKDCHSWVTGEDPIKHCNCGLIDKYKLTAQAIHSHFKPVENDWISVEERLPEVYRIVIVSGGVAVHDGKEWKTVTRTSIPQPIQWEVTHWMPLPEPPKALTSKPMKGE